VSGLIGFGGRVRGGLGRVLLLLILAAPAAAHEAPPAPADHARAYATCMARARDQPDEALVSAGVWQKQGGGDAARHCAAVAMIGLGRYDEAAVRLEALAQDIADTAPLDLRVGVLAQAGQAWLLAADAERALAAQTAALALEPGNIELLIDRGITLASLNKYWEAVDDLNAAHDLAPERPDILIFRASAYRYLDSLDLARDDIERALTIAPNDPDGLLERGILHRLAGEAEAARDDWRKVIAVAEGTPAAATARKNLARLADTPQ